MDVRCEFCETLIDPHDPLVFRKVTGWEQPRDGGGLHALVLREPLDAWACWSCVDRQRKGLDPLQASLI